MRLKLYQVDAFTDKLFSGNPAAICPLTQWISDYMMQNIAMENNLAETAFFVKDENNRYVIRWFTPSVEVDLCGHATLASAYVLFETHEIEGDVINFFSPRSGELTVTREDDLLTLDFPADIVTRIDRTEDLIAGFNIQPSEVFKGKTDYMFVFESEQQICDLQPDFSKIALLKARGAIVTAKGKDVDFVSRFFGPQSGINEDPVTGSAHTTLTPFWYQRTGKKVLQAQQLSPRGGSLECTYDGDRVLISGKARMYMQGEIYIS